MARRLSESEYIERIAAAANGRYALVCWAEEFKGNRTRATCRCLVDGEEFTTAISNLLQGQGCKACALEATAQLKRPAGEVRVAELNAASKSSFVRWVTGEYKNKRSKAIMLCPCGCEWPVSFADVMNGSSCPSCFSVAQSARRLTPEPDAIKMIAASGFQFHGWVGEYVGTSTKATISAPCGHKWESRASSLVNQATGCPTCAETGFSTGKPASLYALMSSCKSMVKLGISNNPEQRLKTLTRETPFPWKKVAQIDSQDGAQIARFEKELHAMTEQAITDCTFDGYTEWRTFTPDIMETLNRMASEAI